MFENERCYICLENLDDAYRFTSCNNDNNSNHLKCGCINRYHTRCLNTWLSIQNKCPICKKKINEIECDDLEFELELDDNDIFYNPLVYFILVYIFYTCLYYIFHRIIFF